jgi:AraC-like DNA-binding protein
MHTNGAVLSSRPELVGSTNHSLQSRTSSSRAIVVTLLEPEVRSVLDRATGDAFERVHVESISAAIQAVREHSPHAFIFSPRAGGRAFAAALRYLIRKSPGTVSIVVLGPASANAHEALLSLGACGVREVVNVTEPEGWNRLRSIVDGTTADHGTEIFSSILPLFENASDESRHFFGTLIRVAPKMVTCRQLATTFRVHQSTLMSRFFRAKLPSPKMYLAMTRLLYASAYFETGEVSIADVANLLAYSSPQSMGRHVYGLLRITAGELKASYPYARFLKHYVSCLIQPYSETFEHFTPFSHGPIPTRQLYRERVLPVRMAAER